MTSTEAEPMTTRALIVPSGTKSGRGRRKQKWTFRRFLARFGVHLTVLFIVAVWITPLLGLIVTSMRRSSAAVVSGWWTVFNDAGLTFQAFQDAIVDGQMGHGLVNSFLIAIPTNVLLVAVATVTAFAFSTMRFKGKDILFLSIVAMLALPPQVALLPLFKLFTQLGLSGEYASVWIFQVGFGMPMALLVLRTYFDSIPHSLYEAAEMDGASPLTTFLRIILPISLPAISSVVILQFISAWNDLLAPLVFIGGGENAPTTVLIAGLSTAETTDNTTVTAAAALISMIVPLIVFFLLQRYYSRGLIAGSSKG
jgi:alpha-glucoside transport system permease protein